MPLLKRLPQIKQKQGISMILLVFIITIILWFITLSLFYVSYTAKRRAAHTEYIKRAYYETEGSLFETVQHIREHPSWISSLPYAESYTINNTFIEKAITGDLLTNSITIQVDGTYKAAKRRLKLEFGLEGEDIPSDIMLLIDRSGSMIGGRITAAKEAANLFVDNIATSSAEHKIGVASFENSASLNKELTDKTNLQDVKNSINGIIANGGTNLSKGLSVTITELSSSRARPSAKKVIIDLSDGISADESGCKSKSNNAKKPPLETTIFSIFLGSNSRGRKLLLHVSSETPPDSTPPPLPPPGTNYTYYYETRNPNDLKKIFETIAEQLKKESIEYGEEEPTP